MRKTVNTIAVTGFLVGGGDREDRLKAIKNVTNIAAQGIIIVAKCKLKAD